MTNYHLKPLQEQPEKPAWQIIKVQRLKLLTPIRQRRAQQYSQFMQKQRRLQARDNLVRELMGAIDFDPASTAQVIQAVHYYDKATNGLSKPWTGRVFLNPPYGQENGESNQGVWSHQLIEQYTDGITVEAVLF